MEKKTLSVHSRKGGFPFTQGFARLTDLDLSCCVRLTSTGLRALRALPLSRLDLSGCRGITCAALDYLPNMPLADLSLANCPDVTCAGLWRLRRLPLTSLSLRGNEQISDGGLKNLPAFAMLRTLCLDGCENLSDECVPYLLGLRLTRLSLRDVPGIRAGTRVILAKKKGLSVSFC